MAEENEEDEEPAVELGEQKPVEGAPLVRVASRLTWPQERSEVIRKEGDATIRTPDGPQQVADVLDDVDVTNFTTRQEFEDGVREVIGTGPIPVADENGS